MELYGYEIQREKDLSHHGILGQKWGVRRYQNPDGTLTATGKKHKEKQLKKEQKKYDRQYRKNYIKAHNIAANYLNGPNGYKKLNDEWQEIMKDYDGDWSKSPRYNDYVEEAEQLYMKVLNESMESLIGKRPE